jgi:hypothetical protein
MSSPRLLTPSDTATLLGCSATDVCKECIIAPMMTWVHDEVVEIAL